MNKFIHRIKLYLKKEITFHFLKQLTLMDIGRWLFKLAHNCVKCGSPNVVGACGKGLYCENCRDTLIKY